MSSTSYILPLKAPTPLSSHGVDTTTFKVWKNTLLAHIQQDYNHHHFLPGGSYSTWQAAEYGTGIVSLHNEDPYNVALVAKRDRMSAEDFNRDKNKLLTSRNAQLAKFVAHIANLCHHTENDDITNHSTSTDWIFNYLKKHYGLETKGANFMNLSDHIFKQCRRKEPRRKHWS